MMFEAMRENEGEEALKRSLNWNRMCLMLILILGSVIRLACLDRIPGDGAINQDEAFAAYEAWCMIEYGTDSHGYQRPVYLSSWDSGMSVLQTYFMIPLISRFGLKLFWIRFPQAVFSILSIAAFYGICKQIRGELFGLIGAGILCITPWHVAAGRWALDCNLFPSFLTIGMYFLLNGFKKRYYLILSAVFFGLSMYNYASPWIVLPLLFFGAILLTGKNGKQFTWDKYTCLAIIIVTILAIPLVVFVMVNMGIVPEIKTALISVPRLRSFRSNEYAINPIDMAKNLYHFIRMLFFQWDGLIWNASRQFGLYYKFAIIPGVLGVIESIRLIMKRDKSEIINRERIMWLWLLSGLLLACILKVNFNQVNIIHIPLIYFIALGCQWAVKRFGRIAMASILCIYIVHSALFINYYATEYNDFLHYIFYGGFNSALQRINETETKTVHIKDTPYSLVLFYNKMPPQEFQKTAVYSWTQDGIVVDSMGSSVSYQFKNFMNEEYSKEDAYICRLSDEEAAEYIRENAERVEVIDTYLVGF